MNRRTGFSLAAFAAVLLLISSFPSAFAQDREDYDHDPPTRVGRIGYTQGTVSFQPGGEGDWLDAVPNRPLAPGDNLWADRSARAEVQLGSSSIRLSSQTSVTLSDLQNNVTQLRLSMGSLFLHIRHLGSDDTFEIDTPNLAFNVTEPGEYRVDVNENGDQTTATVWRGQAEITGGGSSYRLGDRQHGTFSGTEQLSYDVGGVEQDDDFSRWSLDRDRRSERVRSAQYVSPEMTGYEDLDEYGSWHNEGQYGNVWTPTNVSEDWAPYRNGHWAYVSPWGWTWMEDEPWGFAPFHYGRWAHASRGWCWVPGPVAVAPVYSPALVAFVGGGGFSLSIGVGRGGGGGVGWFPLGPGDVYVPPYRTSRRYVENVNVTNTNVNVVNVTNVYNNVTVNHVNNVTYVNQRVNNSVTVVNHDTFVNARPVRSNIVRVDARELQRAQVTHEVAQQIQPQRQSVVGMARPVQAAPPQQVMARPVVATRQPMMVNRAAPVQGMARPAAPPPPQIRKVEAAPRGQAQALQIGARGSSPANRNGPGNKGPETNNAPANAGRPTPAPNAPGSNAPANAGPAPNAPGNNNPANAGRPMPPSEGRRNGTPEAAPARPNENPGNPGIRPGAEVPRPGASPNGTPQNGTPDNGRGVGQRNENNQVNRPSVPNNAPPAPQNSATPMRPNAPDNRPAPETSRPNVPENNRPTHDVPRPGRPDQPQPPRGNTQPDRPQSNAPNARPPQPDNPVERQGQNDRVPPPVRSQEPPPQTRERPVAPPPDVRPQPAPRPSETRPEPPQTRRDASPPVRNEAAPRPPETRNAPPPQQREQQPQRDTRTLEQRQRDKEREKDQNPPKSR